MKLNMGSTDRVIRLVVAGILALLWFQNILAGTLGVIALIVAGIFFVTGVIGICPLYSLFGFNTCSKKGTV
ncbi:MAG: DUF2892 domain-containing protein [Bacteroidetes bacterium]|nr:DUF2892 domain-containing protein [Bacteroidota bacterium]